MSCAATNAQAIEVRAQRTQAHLADVAADFVGRGAVVGLVEQTLVTCACMALAGVICIASKLVCWSLIIVERIDRQMQPREAAVIMTVLQAWA